MSTITLIAPSGSTHIRIGNGELIAVATDGTITADAAYRPELLAVGCVVADLKAMSAAIGTALTVSAIKIVETVPVFKTAKTIASNGSTVTYTIPTTSSYAYITTTASTLAITFPAGASAIDGREIVFLVSADVATASLVSAGATFIGAPASFVANTRYAFKYDHATTKWYPC